MDDVGRLLRSIFVCVAAVLIMGFFTACESCAAEFNDAKLKKMAKHDKRANRLANMLENSSRFITANLISRSVMIVIISTLGTIYYFQRVTNYFSEIFSAQAGSWEYYAVLLLSFLLILCLLILAITEFGINIPKKLCQCGKLGENFILRSSGLYMCWLAIFKPLEVVENFITNGFLRLLGVKNLHSSETVTEEEIMMMVDVVNETGGIEESQAEMISNIFQFDDVEVGEIMTHRTEVKAIEENCDIKEAVELAIETGFSRIPVYSQSVDDIQGVIFAKDLLTLVFRESADNRTVKDFMRDAIFIPESKTCKELFGEFSENKMQIAVVVDEYGGTAGIVTMEDILETIVGNIQDEYDDEMADIVKNPDGSFDILGNASYDDVMEVLGVRVEEDSVFETIGALIIDILGRFPEEDEQPEVVWNNINFKILKLEDKKIDKIRAVKLEDFSGEDTDKEENSD